MNDTFELIAKRPIDIRLIESYNLCNDNMPKGKHPIYSNYLEDYALECIDEKRRDALR